MVLASLENYTVYEATHLAFDTLINIGNKVDLTGKRRLHHYHLLDDVTSLDNKSREFLKLRLSNHFAPATSTEYKRIVRSILPIITKSLQSRQRALVIRGLELLTKISQCPENLQVLSIDIRPTLELLVELLCVSTSSAETIVADAIVIGGDTLGRYRQPMSQGLPGMGYSPFFCELSDQEIRDTALDTIYALCVMSNQIQIQFAQVPHSLEILFRIARTAVQSYSSWLDPRALYSKGDGYGRCNQIMSMVFSQPDAAPQFKAMRIELYLAAAQDDSIAGILRAMLLDSCILSASLFYRYSL